MKELSTYERTSHDMWPKVAIIIINWNGWRDTIECLASICDCNYRNYNIIILDNCSEDDSLNQIKDYILNKMPKFGLRTLNCDLLIEECVDIEESNIILIKADKNYGFVNGNNIAINYEIRNLHSDYILLLNNDTIVDKEFLAALVEAGEIDDRIGIIGPTIYYYDKKEDINQSGGKYNLYTGLGNNNFGNVMHSRNISKNSLLEKPSIEDVDYVEGSCLLIKKTVILEIDMIDPDFVAYGEDVDLCFRAKKAGHRIVYAPNAKIWHKISAQSKKISGYREYYATRNRFLLIKKHANKKQTLSFILFFFFINVWITSCKILICKRDIIYLRYYLKGVWHGSNLLLSQ